LAAFAGLTDTTRLAQLPYFRHDRFSVAGVACRIGRLGYTGEKGFEVIAPRASGSALWRALGARARPAGFAAADCLRIEAGFILFANECRFGATADELRLGRFAGVRAHPRLARFRLVCFTAQTDEKPVLWQPRRDATLPRNRGQISVSSACYSVYAGCTIGLGYVHADEAEIGRHVTDPSGCFRNIRLLTRPLYDPQKSKPRGPWPNDEAARSAGAAK
jgi:aminomethyltransferase